MSTVSVDPGIAPPEERVDVPSRGAGPGRADRRGGSFASYFQIPGHEREPVAAAQNPIVVEPEAGADEVQQALSTARSAPLEAVPETRAVSTSPRASQKKASPVRMAVMQRSSSSSLKWKPARRHLYEPLLHLVAGSRPLGADLGECQVALGQLGPAAVHPVEDVDHEVDRLVLAGHLLDVQPDVLDALERLGHSAGSCRSWPLPR